VVFRHVVKAVAGRTMHQKVGRRYFKNDDVLDGKGPWMIFSGFTAGISMLQQYGPQLQIDTMHRIVHKKNIFEEMLEIHANDMKLSDSQVQEQWKTRCVPATVITFYNNRFYKVKAVRFDLTPESKFPYVQKEGGERSVSQVTFTYFYNAIYNREILRLEQPLLEAYAEKDGERVFLVPELCGLTGITEDIRRDRSSCSDALKQSKVSPQERYTTTCAIAEEIAASCVDGKAHKVMQEWKLELTAQPTEVQGRVFDLLEVCFGQKKFTIEDGNFQRWMRNSLQCPTRLDDWLLIYPETDVSVLDVWLRSLKDIAQVAFSMKLADPTRVVCTDQLHDLEDELSRKVQPSTQLVLLLLPQKDSKAVYKVFKQALCLKYPCVSQVVRSETLRCRRNIACLISRIVIQINAKLCGALWHIELESPATAPWFTAPTMVIGVDVYRACNGVEYFSFVGSLNTHCTEYFSTGSPLEKGDERRCMSIKLQEALRDALLAFKRRNDEVIPEHFIIYRGSVTKEEWPVIRATEVEAINALFKAVQVKDSIGSYSPELTFVAVSKRVAARFFVPGGAQDQGLIRSPEAGTVIDDFMPATVQGPNHVPSFYMISQFSGNKGTAVPTQFTVLHHTAGTLLVDPLQNLTHRLSFLYFNHTGSVRYPAPLQYAKKLAHFIGTAVGSTPRKRLLNTFYYL